MSWLKDRWEEVTAQVKMGDNQTASTVRAARAKAAPATTRVNTNQPGWSVRKPQSAPLTTQQRVNQSYGPVGFSGFKNYLKDYVDNNTEADRIRRAATTGLNESYDQEQDRLTKQAQASNDKLGTIHQVMKSVPAGVAEFVGKTPGSIGQMQGRVAKTVNDINNPVLRTGAKALTAPFGGLMTDKQADYNIKFGQGLNSRVQNKLQQSAFGDRADDNKWVTGAGKMVGQLGGQIATGGLGTAAIGSQMAADEANKAQAAGKSNTYSTLTGLGQGGIGAISEKFGVDRFLPGNNVTGNTVTKLLKRGLTEGTQEVQQQFTQNLIANKAYNPEQGLKDGLAESFVMGGLAGGAMSPAVDIMNRPTAPKPTTSLVAPKPEPTRTRLRPEEARIWSDYQETLYKGNRMPAQVVNETHNKARQIADSLGVDIITGSPDEIAGRMNPLLEQSIAFQKEPTTGLVSRARSRLTPLNEGGYISLGAPEPKKLPQDIKDQFSKQGSFGREAMDRLEANKMSKGDLERAGVVFDPKQVKKIAQTLPEFKANPVMTYRKGDYSYTDAGYGRYPVPEKARSGVFEFKHSRGTMRLNPEALFGKEMAQKLAQTAKDGEQVDFTDTMKASGNRLFTYNQTPDSTVLNRKEPKLNSVEQRVIETEPKRTEIDKDTQMITSIAEPTAKVQKPSNIKESDNSVTVSYGSKGSVNIYRKADGTIGTTTDGLGGNAPSYTKNALELPEVKSKFAQPDPLESLKQEALKYGTEAEWIAAMHKKGYVDKDGFISDGNGGATNSSYLYDRAYKESGLDIPEPEQAIRNKSATEYRRTLDDFRKKTTVDFSKNIAGRKLQSLKEAAKQYTSPDEFIDSFGMTVHRGAPSGVPLSESVDTDFGAGYYFADASGAKNYASTPGREVQEYIVKMNNPFKIKNRDGINSAIDRYLDLKDSGATKADNFREYLKEKGYDGILVEDGSMERNGSDGRYMIVYDKSNIATRQQLTDLYNQATQPPKSTAVQPDPLESLKQEARKYKSAEEFVNSQSIFRGQPKEFGKLQTVESSDALSNILIGRGVFTTSDPSMAKTYGDNVFTLKKPADSSKILDLSNASTEQMDKLGIPKSTQKFYRELVDAPVDTGYIGQKYEIDGDTYNVVNIFKNSKTGVSEYKLANLKYGGGQKYIPVDEFEKRFKPKPYLSDKVNAEEILFEAIVEKYLPDDITWNQVKMGGADALSDGLYIDEVRDKVLKALQEQGVDFIKHQGGIRAGGGSKLHDVYIGLKNEALQPQDTKQLTDLYNQATQSQPPKSTASTKTLNDFNGNPVKKGDTVEVETIMGTKTAKVVDVTDGRYPEVKYKLAEDLAIGMRDPIKAGTTLKTRPEMVNQSTPKTVEAKPPTPFEKDLQTAGLAPKKAKGLVVSETKPLNGQKIQKVRTAPGEVEQRVVQDRSDEIADALGMTQDQREPSFNAVAAAKNSSSAKRLVEALNMNDDITQAAAQAQQDGKEINFFAKKDANGRSVGVERFDPQYHKIDAGFVTDRNGNVLGNHIKVDSTGVQVNVGGDVVNMDRVLGNPIDWRNKYEASSTMERNIYQNAPTKEIADKTYKFTVGHKIQSEANYKTELQQQRKALTDRTKATLAAKPRRVKSEEYKADLFDFIENTSTYTDMVGKYGETTAKVMSDYKTSTRTLYNDLLKRVNEQFGKFGMEQVPQRKDYLTHINELMDKKSYVGELVGQLQNSIADEGKDRTRGAIPTDIAGRSENFKPTKKWNRFFQERRGGEFTKDPFKAVDAYLEPTLHNIHMTESGVRTRAVEATFRTVSQLKNMDTSYVQKELGDSLVKFKVQGDNDKLVRGFQEYANAITGKTEALDRQIIDKSDASATALRGWQKLQSVGGRATILGNLNSVLMQPLNQIATMAQTNPANYLKGIAATISGDKTYQQSPFLKARNAKVDSYFRSNGQKFLDKGAVPLELVEKAAIRNTWNAQYQSVMKDGYKGKEAITETDRRTERTVAGRGIADRPELYRSTLANGVLQYTLEVNAQNKMFWRDLTPVQKAEFMVASSGVNMILGAVTGNTPMPDFIKAMFDSVMDFADGEDDDSVLENAGQAVQRVAGEAASMNPLVSAGANLLPKSARQVAFGKESDLGRYDGTSAPVQVVKNAVDTGSKLAQGKYTDARNSALKTVPFGNQIQKTWRGAEAISEGKTEGSPWQAAKALAFGPNAINTDTAKETRFRATPSKSRGTVNASSVDGKATFAPTVDEILKSQFSTKEQKAWLKLSAADRKAEAEQDPEKAKWLKQYEATKRVNKNAPERPEGLSKESETILNWHNKRTPQQREKLAYTQNDYDYKLATAQFEEAKLNGTVSRAEMINKQQALAKAKVGKDFTKDTRESYNSLSKAELTTLAENDPNGKQIMADAIAYGDALVKAGLIKKNKLRTGSGSGGRRGGRGGKGRASKFDYTKSLFDSGSDSASTSKQLRAILQKAMSGKS